MKVQTLTTKSVEDNGRSLIEILNEAVVELVERSVLVITSKIVAICEGRAVPTAGTNKFALIQSEADRFLPVKEGKSFQLTITNNILIPNAGIDASNGNGSYVLWPRDAQTTANAVRAYLADRFSLESVGVLITDSTSRPLRRGTTGISLAHSGFKALNTYVGTPDIFGRKLEFTNSNIADGLAAAAVVMMGEGAECTPLAVMTDLPNVHFKSRDPTSEELAELHIELENDLYAPLLQSVEWQKYSPDNKPGL